MSHHIHLAPREREDIMVMRRENKGVTEIANAIGRDKSIVPREPTCNSFRVGNGTCCRASTAQASYEQRRKTSSGKKLPARTLGARRRSLPMHVTSSRSQQPFLLLPVAPQSWSVPRS